MWCPPKPECTVFQAKNTMKADDPGNAELFLSVIKMTARDIYIYLGAERREQSLSKRPLRATCPEGR